MKYVTFLLILFCIVAVSCSKPNKDPELFSKIDSSESNFDFLNSVKNSPDINIFKYRNFYNGGGVAVGDINNDGLVDIYMTSNQGNNALYLNKGNFVFEEIGVKAGVQESSKWSTGATMVDINNDGFLDIYVCNAGIKEGSSQHNSFFINNGDLTFSDRAEEYGLDNNGYTTHASFFDYDMDGDLDVYILNNSFIPANTLNYANQRNIPAEEWPVRDYLKGGGDKLYKNEDGVFVDVTLSAGIYSSLIGFGLGVTVGYINDDLYPDLYISNDFFEKDYLYINQKDGTYKEELEQWTGKISHSSMGADMADINNDGYPDLFVTDMLPEDDIRLKTTTTFDNINLRRLKKENGFYNQYVQNTLQLNTQNNNFKEISGYARVSKSDWSWGALIFDVNNDTKQDILVCNGIYHNVIDQDFIDFFSNEVFQKMALSGKKTELDSLIDRMPVEPLRNCLFLNQGNLTFEDHAENSGMNEKTFSNGAAYADLDNDGDYDLIINNVNQASTIYKNNSQSNFVQFSLLGSESNYYGIGAKVVLYTNSIIQSKEVFPSRGFQSSVDYSIIFGLDSLTHVDSVLIYWPNDKVQKMENPEINKFHEVKYANHLATNFKEFNSGSKSPLFCQVNSLFDSHEEDNFTDHHYERNVPYSLSNEGPASAVGDINNDGFIDVYIGGATGQSGKMYLGSDLGFKEDDNNTFVDEKLYEDTEAEFFDANGDGYLDLYVGSGGSHRPLRDRFLIDRLYINDGKGVLKLNPFSLPPNGSITSVIAPYDFDLDGDMDLFVGSRGVPYEYGIPGSQYLYVNNGRGMFTDICRSNASELCNLGMVTDAKWVDVIQGNNKELIVVGDWMSPTVFQYDGSKLEKRSTNLHDFRGWWRFVDEVDIDNDGDNDLILGNLGLNFYLRPDENNPVKLYINDFDNNGRMDKILTRNVKGKDVPVFVKRDLTDQLVSLKKNNTYHRDFAKKSIEDLFDPTVLNKSVVLEVNDFESKVAINNNGSFEVLALPDEIQYSSVNCGAQIIDSLSKNKYYLMGGNNKQFLPQFAELDASYGHLLRFENDTVHYINGKDSGINVPGVIQNIHTFMLNGQMHALFIRNNDKPVHLKLNNDF